MPRANQSTAVRYIQRHGILLLFPIDNKPEPLSLWSSFFPGDEMKWDWSEDGDGRVATLWHLREALSRSDEVVYTKWYRSRATFMSLEVFKAMLARTARFKVENSTVGPEARAILEVLESDSPLPTKRLREYSGLEGKAMETPFNRGMRELWNRLLILGRGEADEGGYPSLAVGATRLLFEDVWEEAGRLSEEEADLVVSEKLAEQPLFLSNYRKFKRLFEDA